MELMQQANIQTKLELKEAISNQNILSEKFKEQLEKIIMKLQVKEDRNNIMKRKLAEMDANYVKMKRKFIQKEDEKGKLGARIAEIQNLNATLERKLA